VLHAQSGRLTACLQYGGATLLTLMMVLLIVQLGAHVQSRTVTSQARALPASESVDNVQPLARQLVNSPALLVPTAQPAEPPPRVPQPPVELCTPRHASGTCLSSGVTYMPLLSRHVPWGKPRADWQAALPVADLATHYATPYDRDAYAASNISWWRSQGRDRLHFWPAYAWALHKRRVHFACAAALGCQGICLDARASDLERVSRCLLPKRAITRVPVRGLARQSACGDVVPSHCA